MKSCTYCGRENDDALAACRECGTELISTEAASQPPSFSRPGRITMALVLLTVLAATAIAVPMLLLAVPVLVLFYSPIYLPFLLSFAIKAHEWRGLRWSLHVSSVKTTLPLLSGSLPC